MPSPLPLLITDLDRLDGLELLIQFSDETSAIYTAQELADLKPDRTAQPDDKRFIGDSGAGIG